MSRAGRKNRPAPEESPYVRGDGAAGRYIGYIDAQGRTFRAWAKEKCIPYGMIGGVATYRKADLDKAWADSVPQQFSVKS